jgi:hypothetical protein
MPRCVAYCLNWEVSVLERHVESRLQHALTFQLSVTTVSRFVQIIMDRGVSELRVTNIMVLVECHETWVSYIPAKGSRQHWMCTT